MDRNSPQANSVKTRNSVEVPTKLFVKDEDSEYVITRIYSDKIESGKDTYFLNSKAIIITSYKNYIVYHYEEFPNTSIYTLDIDSKEIRYITKHISRYIHEIRFIDDVMCIFIQEYKLLSIIRYDLKFDIKKEIELEIELSFSGVYIVDNDFYMTGKHDKIYIMNSKTLEVSESYFQLSSNIIDIQKIDDHIVVYTLHRDTNIFLMFLLNESMKVIDVSRPYAATSLNHNGNNIILGYNGTVYHLWWEYEENKIVIYESNRFKYLKFRYSVFLTENKVILISESNISVYSLLYKKIIARIENTINTYYIVRVDNDKFYANQTHKRILYHVDGRKITNIGEIETTSITVIARTDKDIYPLNRFLSDKLNNNIIKLISRFI